MYVWPEPVARQLLYVCNLYMLVQLKKSRGILPRVLYFSALSNLAMFSVACVAKEKVKKHFRVQHGPRNRSKTLSSFPHGVKLKAIAIKFDISVGAVGGSR